MTAYSQIEERLRAAPRRWLVTGAAGFIGSNLVQRLLELDQRVVGLDNFSTGHRRNLEDVQGCLPAARWSRFQLIEADICESSVCRVVCGDSDVVLHQAALGSVPRSMADPAATHQNNVTGFLTLLIAAREAGIRSFVYASSSSVYGNDPRGVKVEHHTGAPLSPYAASKVMNELYARAFAEAYGFASIGLRYFNVFGPRQDPEGAYAAVIPKWIAALLRHEQVQINGDGETSRDFCFVENVIQANLLAATTDNPNALNQVYNIAVGERTTLHELLHLIRKQLSPAEALEPRITYAEFRSGDVRHSLADISKARVRLGYKPTHRLEAGLSASMPWYRRMLQS